MKRLELIANQSVQEELVQALETGIPGLRYTLIPVAHGRGPTDWKLGTTVWPEENFVLISYQEDDVIATMVGLIQGIKAQFPHEGITVWTMRVE